MTRTIRKILLPLLLTLSMLTGLSVAAFAADSYTQCVTVNQSVKGSPSKTTYTYYLMAMEKGNPMPEGTGSDGLYKFTLEGDDTAKFYLTFTEPGTYNYELRRTEAAPNGDEVSPNVHPFGYRVKANGEIIPFTCYDAYMEIRDSDGNPTEIVLNNNISSASSCDCESKDGCKCDSSSRCKCSSKCNCKNCSGSSSSGSSSGSKSGTSSGTGKTTSTGTTKTGSRVNTGDPYQLGLWIGLITVSIGGLVIIGIVKRKKEKDENNG